MLSRLGAAAWGWAAVPPWTNVHGLARTLLAAGTASTLLFSSASSLFRPMHGVPDYPQCDALAGIGLFCLVPVEHLELARITAIALLLVAASGWQPRLTAVPHWWVTASLAASASIPDGGDQVSAVVTLLLLPIALTDRRRWHWTAPEPPASPPDRVDRFTVAVLVAWSAALVIRVQVAGVYLQSSVAKLGVPEWADGTALFYWLRDPMFGAPGWAVGLVGAIIAHPVGVLALTWGPLVIEFALVLGLVARRRVRPYLLGAGIALHVSIGLLMGIWSFAIAMIACLVLFLRPLDQPVPAPKSILRPLRSVPVRA